jgi:hypothetical protein
MMPASRSTAACWLAPAGEMPTRRASSVVEHATLAAIVSRTTARVRPTSADSAGDEAPGWSAYQPMSWSIG